jgi:isoleucyl-tRNA synthetase
MAKELLKTNLSRERWKEFFKSEGWQEIKNILEQYIEDAKNDMMGSTGDFSNPFVTMSEVYSIGGSIRALQQISQLDTILTWEDTEDE